VHNVVVNSVEVTSDLWLARVYVRVTGEGQERSDALKGLEAAASFIRRELAAGLHIHRIPELRFLEDETLDRATRIEEILEGLDTSPPAEDEPSNGSRDGSDGGAEITE
jgi:ribosome-binding factor A